MCSSIITSNLLVKNLLIIPKIRDELEFISINFGHLPITAMKFEICGLSISEFFKLCYRAFSKLNNDAEFDQRLQISVIGNPAFKHLFDPHFKYYQFMPLTNPECKKFLSLKF